MTRVQAGRVSAAQTVLLVLALGATAPVAAQVETEPRVWTAVSVQGRVGSNSPWRWAADSLVRTRNGAATMDLLGEWVSVSRDLTRRSSAGIGYAYATGFSGAGSRHEHRFVQQYIWSAGVDWRTSFRTRLEERVISGNDGMLIRVRQQVRVTWPLTTRGILRGVASEEVFVKANATGGAARGFDGNRLFVGIGRTVTARSGVEVGYVSVYSAGAPSRNRRTHVMSATLVVSLQ